VPFVENFTILRRKLIVTWNLQKVQRNFVKLTQGDIIPLGSYCVAAYFYGGIYEK